MTEDEWRGSGRRLLDLGEDIEILLRFDFHQDVKEASLQRIRSENYWDALFVVSFGRRDREGVCIRRIKVVSGSRGASCPVWMPSNGKT